MAAEHEAARQAAHDRKYADKVGEAPKKSKKEKRGAMGVEERVSSEENDAALDGWEDER